MIEPKALNDEARTCVMRDAGILGGAPIISGTRVPAMTIIAYLRDGYAMSEIFDDFPSLPDDSIDAVETWADRELGPTWRAALPVRTA